MRENLRNFLVGLVTLVAIVSFVVLLFLFGELDELLNPRYAIVLQTNHASGLRAGSAVELNGVPVGIVDAVESRTQGQYPVEVVAMIDLDVDVPSTVRVFSMTGLLGGSGVLELQTDDMTGATILPRDGTAVLTGPLPSRLIEEITGELDARTAPLIDALADFSQLASTYDELGHNINRLFNPQSEQELAGGATPNIATTMLRLDAVLIDTQEALALARRWLDDEQLNADVRSAVSKSVTLMEEATAAVREITRVAGSVEGHAATIAQNLVPVTDELTATLEQVRTLTRRATEGDGTIGMLLNNPDLYHSLDDAAQRLERTLRELQLFLEKIKAEGIPLNL
jgi:phospholipid/cholesterol/gamma-HCH transport system substrate-binding protein